MIPKTGLCLISMACIWSVDLTCQMDTNPNAIGVTTSGTIVVPQPPTSSVLTATGYDDHALFAAAAGNLLLADLEGLPSGTLLTNQLLSTLISGFTGSSQFGPGPTSQYATASTSLPFPMFVSGTLPTEPNFCSNDLASPVYATGEITVQYLVPIYATGAYVADQAPLGGFQIEVFLAGVSQGLIQVSPRTLPSSFVGIISTVPFDSARFSALSQYDSWGLDNIEVGLCGPATVIPVADTGGRNAPNSISEFPTGNMPQLGNATFRIAIDDPANSCRLTNSAIAGLAMSLSPSSSLLAGFGCGAGIAGEVMINPTQIAVVGTQPWGGSPASFSVPIPSAPWLCGVYMNAQGFWLDPASVSGPVVLTWRLDIYIGT
ncbi:MAG: hypothetical protein KDC98_25600 [Planctomycetes bacterium]|nr:hypothetical protein [Planctomycetota bacterium]